MEKILLMGRCKMDRERNITVFEEQVLRCVHHQFAAVSQADAAKYLKVSESKISRALTAMQDRSKTIRAISIMFPILTPHQFKIYKLCTDQGKTTSEIADIMDMTESAVRGAIAAMRKKGQRMPSPIAMGRYNDGMDSEIADIY